MSPFFFLRIFAQLIVYINAILRKPLPPGPYICIYTYSMAEREKIHFTPLTYAAVNYRGSGLILFLVPGEPSSPESAYPER